MYKNPAVTNPGHRRQGKGTEGPGIDVIGFGAGEPDFDTPANIKEAAKKAIDAGFTKYTPVGGTDELKDAIIAKMKRDHGLDYTRDEISVACGAKHSLYNISQALIQEGDEVIIPAPTGYLIRTRWFWPEAHLFLSRRTKQPNSRSPLTNWKRP